MRPFSCCILALCVLGPSARAAEVRAFETVPLGSFLENDIARVFALPATDLVLYVGVCGKPLR